MNRWGPQVGLSPFANQVDTAVRPPPARPVIPQPHIEQPFRIPGIGFEEPLTDVLELLAPLLNIVREVFAQFSEGSHWFARLGLVIPTENCHTPVGQWE